LASEENIMTVTEVARYLHVHPSTIYRLLKENELQGFKVGRDWRFKVQEIDRLRLAQQTLGAPKRRSDPRSLEAVSINASAGAARSIGVKVDDSPRSTPPEVSLQREAGAGAGASGQAHEDPSVRRSESGNRYGHFPESELHGLRQLEEENRRLRRIVADQALVIQVLKELLAK
jgi:putative transposase